MKVLLLITEFALNVQRESVGATGAAVEGVGKEESPVMGHDVALDRSCRVLHLITQTSVNRDRATALGWICKIFQASPSRKGFSGCQ